MKIQGRVSSLSAKVIFTQEARSCVTAAGSVNISRTFNRGFKTLMNADTKVITLSGAVNSHRLQARFLHGELLDVSFLN